jgi:hypothetical protein
LRNVSEVPGVNAEAKKTIVQATLLTGAAFAGSALLPAAGVGIAALFGWVWGSLTVRIQDGALCIRFGPGWPRKTVQLADISAVEITRTSFIDGWGVHRTRRGWLYNVSGYDAVLLKLASGRNLLVGSNEPRRLQAALQRAAARA